MSAEFLHQHPDLITLTPTVDGDRGFAAMGKPVPFFRRQAGYEHCRQMGCSSDAAFAAVNAMSEALKRDEPYNAMAAGMKYLDLIGTYRLMAVLLTASNPKGD